MRLFSIFITFLFFSLLAIHPSQAQMTDAKQAIIIDYETGQTLLSKNPDEKMPTSSMSKVMTMYMTFKSIEDGIITMDSELPVSEEAWKKGGSKMFVELGKNIKVEDLVRGVIIQSGNDATIVLAEGISGSEDRFAQKITEEAKKLGMENTHFANASGWPDPNHYSTAKDLSILAKAMIDNYPEYYKIFGETEFTYNNIKQQNRNPLLYRNIGADGMKTGHTDDGGYGLIGTAKRDGRRVIMVINGLPDNKARAQESARLINWALDHFTNLDFIKGKTKIADVPVAMGIAKTIPAGVKDDMKITVPKSEKDSITVDVKYKSPLIAPIKAGQEIGTLVINIPTIDPISTPLYALEGTEEVGLFKKTLFKIQNTLFGK